MQIIYKSKKPMKYSAHILFTLLIVAFIVVSTMTKHYRPDSGIWRYVSAIVLRTVQSKPFKSVFNTLKMKLKRLSTRIKRIPLFCKHRNRGNLITAIIFLLFLNSMAGYNMAYIRNSYKRIYKLCPKQIAKHGINNAVDPAKETSYMRYQTCTKQLVI